MWRSNISATFADNKGFLSAIFEDVTDSQKEIIFEIFEMNNIPFEYENVDLK